MRDFLRDRLALELHPQKITIRKYSQGVDFLGYVLLPHYRLLRTKTKRRMMRKLETCAAEREAGRITQERFNQSLQSCLGVLSHSDAYRLSEELENQFWFR
ncbi:MAG: hypothetical protein AAB671_02240 [Patescibacteria group bacterium]